MGARIVPFPHPHSIVDAFGSTIEVSHHTDGAPRVVVEITEGEIVNVHLTIAQAEALKAALAAQIEATKREWVSLIQADTQRAQRAVAAAASDNLPGDAA